MPDTDLRLHDKRTIDRAIRIGTVDEKAWERHLKSLPDSAEKAEPVTTVYQLMDEDDVADDDEDDAGDEAESDAAAAPRTGPEPVAAG